MLKLVGHTKKIIGHKSNIQVIIYIVFMKGSKRESNPELPRHISTKGDGKQSNAIGMLTMQLARLCYSAGRQLWCPTACYFKEASEECQAVSEQDLTNLYNVSLWFKIPNRCTCDVSSDSLLHLLIGDQSIDTEDEKLLDLFYHKDFLIRGYIKKKKKKKSISL